MTCEADYEPGIIRLVSNAVGRSLRSLPLSALIEIIPVWR
jgi:hypothetical protein